MKLNWERLYFIVDEKASFFDAVQGLQLSSYQSLSGRQYFLGLLS